MSPESGNLIAKSAIPLLQRHLRFDLIRLFKASGEAVVDLIDGQRVSAGKKIFDAISAGSLKDDIQGLAWLLITKSLANAAFRIAAESRDHLPVDPESMESDRLPALLNEQLEIFSKKLEAEITPDFLDNPGRLPIIEDMKNLLQQWLLTHEMPPARAGTAIQRLNDYFVEELDYEWRMGQSDYRPLESVLVSPLRPASDMARAWITYNAYLKKQIREPLFGVESFDVTQVYVPLRAYYVEKKEEKRPPERPDLEYFRPDKKRNVIDLHQNLEDWIKKDATGNSLKVITGGPGSGKSTFSKTLAAELAEQARVRVLLIPLHNFGMSGDLKVKIGEYLKDGDRFKKNPLEEKEDRPLVIIFDGLDELPLQEIEALENARQFIRHVNEYLSRYQLRRLLVLITGRTLAIEYSMRELPENEQVFHLLPYALEKSDDVEYHGPEDLLEADQRNEWWQKYGKVTGLEYEGLPSEIAKAGKKVDDLTAQPLLNYLVALTLKDGKIDFSRQPNVAEIYDDLLRQVYEGVHNNKRISPMIRDLNRDEFERLLQEVAVTVWHGGYSRGATLGRIKERCEKCKLDDTLQAISQDSATGLLRLMAAFYFRHYGGSAPESKIIEFTHKSFYEYLVAKRIVEEIRTFQDLFDLMKKNPQVGFNEKEALKRWAELCGPTAVNADLFEFIHGLTRVESSEQLEIWQNMLVGLFNYMIRSGLPMEKLDRDLSFKEMSIQSANAEEALLAAISACARVTERMVEIEWSRTAGFGGWLQRIQGQKEGMFAFAVRCLYRIKLPNTILRFSLLMGADLSAADLSRADLSRADLSRADLSRADLSGAILFGANLSGANLPKVDLSGANLSGAHMPKVDLSRANLSGADLSGGAYMPKVDLSGANLSGADLSGGAHMPGVDLSGADLSVDHLSGADLSGADLTGADLRHASKLSEPQIAKVKSLYQAKLNPQHRKLIEKKYLHLLEKPVD